MPTLSDIENFIYFEFMRGIYNDLEKQRRREIHVSDLVYDCLRRGYYAIKHNIYLDDVDMAMEVGELNEKKLMTFWIGKKLHEVEMTPYHHYKMVVNFFDEKVYEVHGEVDEVFKLGNDYIVVDKKTCRVYPRGRGYYVHHKLQVEYYAVMLNKIEGIKPRYGAIVYMNVVQPSMRIAPFLIRDLADVEKEMMNKTMLLGTCLKNNVPPPPCKGWICKYCMFYEQCVKEGV